MPQAAVLLKPHFDNCYCPPKIILCQMILKLLNPHLLVKFQFCSCLYMNSRK
uniref:Uncharacterized protein n=1 Tax=Anguilla anguilla TaxID=7936 RepID=A0A0E9SDK2_ANGAN